MIYKGLKFGMMLQLAIGPMCLLVFQTSATLGFITGLSMVAAIALVDGLFITLSGFGVAAIINKKEIKIIVKILGCFILILFGINTITGVLHYSLLPEISLFSKVSNQNFFIQGVLLTASNPLTIIFWSGVFSTQVIEYNLTKKQLVLFGIGCVLSTLLFLSIIAFSGSVLSSFLPQSIISVFNIIVGFILIYYGIRILYKK